MVSLYGLTCCFIVTVGLINGLAEGAQIKLTINNCEHTKAEIAFIFTKLNITLQESRFQEILAKNRRKKKLQTKLLLCLLSHDKPLHF